jgi:hypothetical protein
MEIKFKIPQQLQLGSFSSTPTHSLEVSFVCSLATEPALWVVQQRIAAFLIFNMEVLS